jgi:chaperone modulatory protein CbpM
MLQTIEEVVAEIEVSQIEVVTWIERRWVLPVEQEGQYLFDEADRARVALIAELHRDLGVGEDAMPLVLRLLDQLYTLRRALGELQDAIKDLPEEARRELERRLHKP